MADKCPFCGRIGRGEFESSSAGPFPEIVWFEPLGPVTPGHMLFVPTLHVESARLAPYTAGQVLEVAAEWWSSEGAKAAGTPDCNFITSCGPAATQTVRHLHLHVVPRREGDGLHLPWTGQEEHGDVVAG